MVSGISIGYAQTNPFNAPLYWSVYEHHIEKEYAGVSDNYIPESELMANVNWVDENLKDFGYTMICMDGWGDVQQLNENGYRKSHSSHWEHDFQWWSDTLQARGMTLGMYGNPLWIHVDQNDTETLIVGTPLPVSSLIDPDEDAYFTWVQVDQAGAEQYVKGCVQYYADMGIQYYRVDFLSWYETGYDHWVGTVGPERPREDYETALQWMREACDENGMFLSLVMPNLFPEGALEAQYGHMIRINADAGTGTWYRFSDHWRGHHFNEWSQYENTMDGFAYWSRISGREAVILDGDFIRINTYASDSEKRAVISAHIMAGGPVSVTDEYSSIGDDIWLYQNEELLALNTDGFVGAPGSSDPTSDSSQIWYGQLSTGEWVVAFFNRETETLTRNIQFTDLGLDGQQQVIDLWQHADLGNMTSLEADIPTHGVMVVKISDETANCSSQTILFDPIADQNYNGGVIELSAQASSGLEAEYEIAMGPATVSGNQLTLTGANGRVAVLAYQGGDEIYCAAIPVVQSFEVSGGHQSEMHVAGEFTNWNPTIDMQMVEDVWIADHITLSAGAHEIKFANTSNWTGDDWGNASGIAGVAHLTTGGGPNISFQIGSEGEYKFSFNDINLTYFIQPSEPVIVHQPQMFVAGTFSDWSLTNQMHLVDDVWVVDDVVIYAGVQELKFANSNDWSGDDWGNNSGLSGVAQLTTGGDPNISFSIAAAGYFDIYFDDVSLEYSIGNSLAADDSETTPDRYMLSQNFPNPFNPQTTIEYSLAEDGPVSLVVYDALGRKRLVLVDGNQKQGQHSIQLDGSHLVSGIYFYRLESESFHKICKMTLLR